MRDVSFLKIWAILVKLNFYQSNKQLTTASDSLFHSYISISSNEVYPEEAVGGFLRPQTALHTRRQLVYPAHSKVIIIVTGLLSGHKNMHQNI